MLAQLDKGTMSETEKKHFGPDLLARVGIVETTDPVADNLLSGEPSFAQHQRTGHVDKGRHSSHSTVLGHLDA